MIGFASTMLGVRRRVSSTLLSPLVGELLVLLSWFLGFASAIVICNGTL